MAFLKQSVLALKILLLVLMAALGVFLLATTVGVVHERNKALHIAHTEVNTVVTNNLDAIALALWSYDDVAFSTLLRGMSKISSIARLELSDNTKIVADVSNPAAGNKADRVWSITIVAPDGKTAIGSLKITESYTEIYQRIDQMVEMLVVTELFKIIGLAIILFVIVYRKVARHLHDLAMNVVAIDPGNLNARVSLNRRHTSTYRDELDILVESFNHFLADRKKAAEQLLIAATAFESQEAMMVTDTNGIVLRINKAFAETTGYSPEEIVGQTPRLLRSGRHDEAFYRQMWESINFTGAWQGEIWDRHKSGNQYLKWLTISAVRNAEGGITHYIGTHYDLTERKKAEERINALAFYDQLTNLPNRILLVEHLNRSMAASLRSGSHGALLFIDLDNFKTLNDTQGHEMGDLLLKQVADRLKQCVRGEDTVARQGGDEFVVLLSDLGTGEPEAASTAESIAEKILEQLNLPYQIGHFSHHSTASIGVTLFSGNQSSVDDLMKQADLAMYRAKGAGRNIVRFFDPAMEAIVKVRAELEDDLRQAIDKKQFLLHYQPQVVDDGRITGAEVLVRWQHPLRGMISPADFIPLAEDTDLILPLGQWVLETACRKLALWSTRPETAALNIAVNVSAKQFRQPGFVDQVLAAVKQSSADPRRLKLELTESLLVDNVEEIIEKMHRLKAKGIGFSLDDFGTGYSSLSYLKRLPLDQLKIDQSFVRDVLSDPNDAAIAKTIVTLGQSLGLAVIAEGVETQAQRDFLANAGCYAYQGYFFSKPLPEELFEQFLDHSHQI
ncbi:MAG: EAL domain-containing protein [Dechloromonas sp.]|uniref:EAL domain-containing protein n=1 Tax=Candidatus Dechloromonas phosphorivorans TaxID=2899244 RepID=A0A935JXD0_9RHOO|nr:EAL domain-containing protein [Candidatus Dechloromonas phosphorivorans]